MGKRKVEKTLIWFDTLSLYLDATTATSSGRNGANTAATSTRYWAYSPACWGGWWLGWWSITTGTLQCYVMSLCHWCISPRAFGSPLSTSSFKDAIYEQPPPPSVYSQTPVAQQQQQEQVEYEAPPPPAAVEYEQPAPPAPQPVIETTVS